MKQQLPVMMETADNMLNRYRMITNQISSHDVLYIRTAHNYCELVLCDGDITLIRKTMQEFEKGKIHGIIGRNGSGKTVLLKCICGFLSMDKGSISVDGRKVMHSCPQDIGIILETPGFIQNKSGFQNLKMLASIRGKVSREEIRAMLEKVGLDKSGVEEIRKILLGLKEEGITILLASHYAEDVDILCDTVWEMDQGKLQMIRDEQ